jgi:hypothetical protein
MENAESGKPKQGRRKKVQVEPKKILGKREAEVPENPIKHHDEISR